ncbi:hypothetical protein M413DRAFT_25105 [Hebeloma cylindrosporum]|uniref:Uncharacterized protein n=1 Tax=Hebeloma cylindrosporum TaxID=76867 RepID=A0A0C2Y4A0_HEBCY|nr:hypothetical protein M413DRAFT_25105 [Hebeloma cylindrosporum h7]
MSSLNIALLAGSTPTQLLLSESVTLDSLSSTSSCSLPEFPGCKPQTFSMVGLGDCLKMFSGDQTKPGRATVPDATASTRVVITAPTPPRLKFLLKECLSISKWAETSAGWRAPGHIPWGSSEETSLTQWIPEGSVISPDNLSLALWKSRGGFGEPRSRPSRLPNPIMDLCTGRDSMDVELDDVMSELKSLRSLFQTPIEGDHELSEPFLTSRLHNLTVPSLVVSNSHCTFPIALESSRSISRFNAVPLAHRRGKKVSPLIFAQQEKLKELSYPGIPTAFLGSQSPHTPLMEPQKFDNRPILGFEDMINNLRLQCLTMNLQTPPPDESWNSRSATVVPVSLGSPKKNLADQKQTAHGKTVRDLKSPLQRPLIQPKDAPARPKKIPSGISVQPKRRNAQTSALVSSPKPKPTNLRARSPSKRVEVVNPKPRVIGQGPLASRVLRSAMVKVEASGPRSPVKNVRFVLTSRDLDKGASSTKLSNAVPSTVSRNPLLEHSERQKLPEGPDPAPRRELAKFGHRSTSPLARGDAPKLSVESRETRFRNSLPTRFKRRENSVTVNPSYTKTPDSSEKDKVSSRMSTQSLGRSSLGRIMRGPMFSAWDNKRATIALSAQSRLDENVLRRESQIPSFVEKKSRMPVPLRNIFTRFK